MKSRDLWASPWVAGFFVAGQLVMLYWLLLGLANGSHHPALPGDVTARFMTIANYDQPWSGQAVEFPPLSVLILRPLRGLTDDLAATYVHAFVQLALHVGTVATVWFGWGRKVAARYLMLTLPILPLLLMRLDLLSVLLAALGLLILKRGYPAEGGAVVGVAVLAKVWPGVLLVVAGRRFPRFLAAGLAIIAVGGLAWVSVVGIDAVGQVLGFRGARGWHMESVVGVAYRAVAGGDPAIEAGAWRFGVAPLWAKLALAAVGVGGLLWKAWNPGELYEDMVFAVGLLLVTAPLLSPQYLVWLSLPLALARPRLVRDILGFIATLASAYVIYRIGPIIRAEWIGVLIPWSRNLAVVGITAMTMVATSRRGIASPA